MTDRSPTRVSLEKNRGVFYIAGLYMVIGGLWIVFSDQLAVAMVKDPAMLTSISILKGLGYVVLTTLLLYWLIWRHTAALRASEARYRLLAENMADVVWILDVSTMRFNYISPSVERLCGYSADEVLAQSMTELVSPTSLAMIREKLPERLQTFLAGDADAVTQTDQVEQTHRDGSIVMTEVVTTLLKNRQGAIEILGVSRDITERWSSEEVLRENEERFRTLFENSNVGIYRTTVDGRILLANPTLVELLGYSSFDELSTRNLERGGFEPSYDRALFIETIERDGEVKGLEASWTRLDGAAIFIRESARAIRDTKGKTLYYDGTVEDISDRKRTEQALRESERQMRALLTSLDDIVFEFDEVGTYLNVWATDEKLLARPRKELIGKRIAEVLGEDLARPYIESFTRVLGSGQPENIDYSLMVPSGLRWFHARINAIPSAEGSYQTVSMLVRDVTERKQADDALRKRTEELTLLLEAGRELSSTLDLGQIYTILYRFIARSVPCDTLIVSSFDPEEGLIRRQYLIDNQGEGDVSAFPAIPLEPEGRGTQSQVIRSGKSLLLPDYETYRNTASTRYDADQKGNIVSEIPEEAERPRSAILVPLSMEGHVAGILQVFSYQSNAHTEDHLRFVEALVFRLTAAMSNAVLFQRVQSELVERRRAEEEIRKLNVELEQRVDTRTADLSRANAELAQAARAKDEFLASMSHELRTPLNAILTLAESLEEGTYGPLNEGQLRPLHTIAESGHHLLNLINDILDLSKIEAGKLELQIAPVEVGPLCEASLRLVKQQAQKKRQQVSLDVDKAVTSLRADGRYLKQMLVNLLSNAVKFTPEGGRIGLEVRGDAINGVAHFVVWDTGIGVAPEAAQRLFRPFVQVDSGLARQYSGTGLGLSLVYRMAEMHGGSVSMESTLGEGSRFIISLRWAGTGESRGTGPLIPAYAPKVYQALVIEDSPTAGDQMARYLGEIGARVTVCPAGKAALDKAIEVQPDVILLDIQLPDLSGWEVLEKLKADKRTGSIPVIVVTVVDEPGRGMALGAADYVVKPLTRPRLHEALWNALAPALDSGATESASARQPMILIAEDNPANQATYSDYLSTKGFRVILAANGAEAIDRARESRPDLILMDVQMPRMDGLEATRRLRADADLRAIPIIALTALAMPGDRERCLAAGVDDYMAKPIRLRQLVITMETYLHRRRT